VVSRLPPPTASPVETRFRFGCAAERLNLADDGKSPDHYAKSTPSPGPCGRRAPTACRRVVSGSLSSPHRGSSHLSLALLGSLSVAREYLALRDGPRRFGPASTCRVLLRCRTGPFALRLRDFHPLRPPIPEGSAGLAGPCVRSFNPARCARGRAKEVECESHWHARRMVAREECLPAQRVAAASTD
jgi:hypothetical protein